MENKRRIPALTEGASKNKIIGIKTAFIGLTTNIAPSKTPINTIHFIPSSPLRYVFQQNKNADMRKKE